MARQAVSARPGSARREFKVAAHRQPGRQSESRSAGSRETSAQDRWPSLDGIGFGGDDHLGDVDAATLPHDSGGTSSRIRNCSTTPDSGSVPAQELVATRGIAGAASTAWDILAPRRRDLETSRRGSAQMRQRCRRRRCRTPRRTARLEDLAKHSGSRIRCQAVTTDTDERRCAARSWPDYPKLAELVVRTATGPPNTQRAAHTPASGTQLLLRHQP